MFTVKIIVQGSATGYAKVAGDTAEPARPPTGRRARCAHTEVPDARLQPAPNGVGEVEVQVESNEPFRARLDLSARERQVVVAGGVLNHLATERTRHDHSAP